jgi:isopenicillin-N epimerase
MRSPFADHWGLDPDITFLNHGSFGACPTVVLEEQSRVRARLEREPVRFMIRELEGLLAEARRSVAHLVGAQPDDLAFVPNASSGVSTVLRSLALRPDDELLTTDHVYGACRNALVFAAEASGARLVVAPVPFPLSSSEEVVNAVLARVTTRTRLLLIDHVTSPTAVIFPVERMVAALAARGVDTLVDGAHAPGMLPLALDTLGAAYYTANCHKWLCAPKGSAFLHVRRDRQRSLRPLTLSHGAASARRDVSRFRLEHDWTGTVDPSAYLAVPRAIQFLEQLMPGGLPALRAYNHALILRARATLCAALGVAAPAPESLVGSMVTLPLPPGPGPAEPWQLEPLQDELFYRHRLELPVFRFGAPERRWLRVTAQAYNCAEDYERLAAALS